MPDSKDYSKLLIQFQYVLKDYKKKVGLISPQNPKEWLEKLFKGEIELLGPEVKDKI